MMEDRGQDVSLKEVLESRPKGSFLFPKNVVIEEVLEHIDETWTALWEGTPFDANHRSAERYGHGKGGQAKFGDSASEGSASETSVPRDTDPPKKLSWFNRTLSRLSPWSKKSTLPVTDRVFSIDRIHSFIPRYRRDHTCEKE